MNSRVTHLRRLLVLLVLAAVAAVPATASAGTFPDTIRLPDGWQPEGIASGRGTSLYVGSIPTGAVWKGDARTGEGDVLVPPRPGERSAIGIKVDKRNRLFVAGGATGKAFVYDARTGEDLASYQLAPAGTAVTFVNDVVVTSKAAWFTDSRNQQLYALPLGRHGALPDQDDVRVLPLTGELEYTPATTDVDLNGIVAAEGGRVLLSVQSSTGKLFRINPRTGKAREVDLGGATLTNGDGLLLAGRVLFVVQNRLNQIAVVVLSRSLDRGRVVTTIADPDFDVPTTIAFQAGRLYAVNARFGTTDPQPARYDIVKVG
ncbi:MAG TPA: superoxide dismutase [Actinomycetes bacterium]|nr:superoxide dismutase [Actinomycetes bacterium]